ncbi:acyl-CoA dehydrogenase family protein [Nonomuraea typhae]|uniref:acyl-CoA dehydrogenase family protein n=1 Tax=Nonomuraea typhae TaxID=2603600 RepID=UPI001FE8180C|nr:acyl-CoA dehydrogenase family protein [Nonomuraea typhae]
MDSPLLGGNPVAPSRDLFHSSQSGGNIHKFPTYPEMGMFVSELWGAPECPREVRDLRDRVTRFVAGRVVPHEAELDAGGATARDLVQRLKQEAIAEGLWGLPLPPELGGAGLSLPDYAHVAEAEGASDHGPAVLGSTALLDMTVLGEHPDHLHRLARGELTLCNAMTEPDTPGSDPSLITTRARPEPDGSWTLHGRKWFVTGADRAGLALVLARAPAGPSAFLVPTGSPGFRLERELTVLGAGGQWELTLDAAPGHLVGAEGKGLRVAGRRVRLGRLLRCLRWLGQARRAFLLMRRRARERTLSTGRLADHQLVQALVFDALLAIRTTRPLVFQVAALLEAGRDARRDTALAKVAAARMLQQVSDAAVQVYGAAGLGPGTPLPALFRMGRMARLLDGPDELHITTVARGVLDERPA